MRDEVTEARGWIAGTRLTPGGGHSPRPLPVLEAPGHDGEHVTVPAAAFEPPARAPVKMQRLGREVYALRESAQAASETLAEYYNDQNAKREGAART